MFAQFRHVNTNFQKLHWTSGYKRSSATVFDKLDMSKWDVCTYFHMNIIDYRAHGREWLNCRRYRIVCLHSQLKTVFFIFRRFIYRHVCMHACICIYSRFVRINHNFKSHIFSPSLSPDQPILSVAFINIFEQNKENTINALHTNHWQSTQSVDWWL